MPLFGGKKVAPESGSTAARGMKKSGTIPLPNFVQQMADGVSAATSALVPDAVLRVVAPSMVTTPETELARLKAEMEAMKDQLADQQKAGMQGELVLDQLRATKLSRTAGGGGNGGVYLPSPCLQLELRGREQKTKKAANTTSPAWSDERLVFTGVRGELTTPALRATLVEWGTMGDQALVHASAELDLKPLRGKVDALELTTPLSTGGTLQMRASWVPRVMGKVVLRLEGANGLTPPTDATGKEQQLDLYAWVKVGERDQRTGHAKGTLSPFWRQKFEWDGLRSKLTERPMIIEVRNNDPVYVREHGKAAVLGRAELSLREMLIDDPHEVHSVEIDLKPGGHATLEVHWETSTIWVDDGAERYGAESGAFEGGSADQVERENAKRRRERAAHAQSQPMTRASMRESLDDMDKEAGQMMEILEAAEARGDAQSNALDGLDEKLEEEFELEKAIQKEIDEFEHQASLVSHQPAWQEALRVVRDAAFRPETTIPQLAHLVLEQLLAGEGLTAADHQAMLLLVHPERHGHLYVVASTEAAVAHHARAKEDAEWSPSSHNDLTVAAYSVLHSGEPVLSFRPHPNHLSIAPLTEKGGRVFGVLLDGPPPVPDEWLMRMAKTAGPMIEMIWRREQLATVIKVAQAWVQDYANTPDAEPIEHMAKHPLGKRRSSAGQPGGGARRGSVSTRDSSGGPERLSKRDSVKGAHAVTAGGGGGGGGAGSSSGAKPPPKKSPRADSSAKVDHGQKKSKRASQRGEDDDAAGAPAAAPAPAPAPSAAEVQAKRVKEAQAALYSTKLTALWFEAGGAGFRCELEASKTKPWEGKNLDAFGAIGMKNAVQLDEHMDHVRILIKHGNGLAAGIFKVQPLSKEHAHLSLHVVNMLFATTAPTLQQAVNDIATMHIGDAPPKSRLGAGAGASMEAHAQMLLPKKLQQQMRLQLAKIDTAKLMGELHGYKQPPEDVHKVVRGVLVLMGHGRSTGQDTSTWELCRPHLTFQLIKDMQTFDVVVVSSKHHTEERWKESLQATDGVDAEQVFQKFPHGVKVMMQWLEAARLVHRMAHQVKAQEEKRKKHIREIAAAAIQSMKRGQHIRLGLHKLLADARQTIAGHKASEAERRAKVAEWREQMLDPWAVGGSKAPPADGAAGSSSNGNGMSEVAHGVGSMAKGMTHALDSAAHKVADTLGGHSPSKDDGGGDAAHPTGR